jgi:hypothetical protein
MQDNNKEPGLSEASTPSNRSRKKPLNSDDEIRRFLARCTVLLIALDLIVYAITRDIGVLAGTTVVGIAVYAVFRHYFPHRD